MPHAADLAQLRMLRRHRRRVTKVRLLSRVPNLVGFVLAQRDRRGCRPRRRQPDGDLGQSCGHSSTLFRASGAFSSAALTVIGSMLAAFLTAGIADFRAHGANVLGKARSATHEGRRQPADRCTILVEANTFGHLLDVLFAETRLATVFAHLGTPYACCDAGLILYVWHG